MPATCPTCGEEALTDNARYCVGCGGPLPEVEPASLGRPEPEPGPEREHAARGSAETVDAATAAPEAERPPSTSSQTRGDTPRFSPRPAPSRPSGREAPVEDRKIPPGTEAISDPTPRVNRSPEHRRPRDPPMVPPVVVIVGIVALLALLITLLLVS